MTQTQPDRLDQLESVIERIDRKLDAIATDLVGVKVSQAKIEGTLEGISKRLDGIETRSNAQDGRFWTLIVGVFLAIFTLIAKLAFFPQA
jgi:predicted  nucleic acid-binding Zn-ribbon protein